MRGVALTYQPQSLRAAPGETIFAETARHGAARARRATWVAATDVLSLLALVFSIPFVILAVGLPIALALQLLLWLGRLL
jgi:hypothetical protein